MYRTPTGYDIYSDFNKHYPERRRRRKRRPKGLRMGKPANGGTLTGNIRVHEHFYSRILNNNRHIFVYLPPSYTEANNRRYPVLYVNDGQNLFDAETAFAGVDWGMDETLEFLIHNKLMKEIITVAIYNTPNRTDEYTHIPDPEEGGGKAEYYAAFLINELKPFMDRRYKTSRNSDETGILGSSFGGLNALYIGWNYPDVFSIVGAISPSLWWAEHDIIKLIAFSNQPYGPSKIWLDMGTEEDDEEDEEEIYNNIEQARILYNVLLSKGYTPGENLFYFEDEGATHDEWAWGNRIDSVLMALFPPEED